MASSSSNTFEQEKMALELVREKGKVTREEVVSELDLRTSEEASDIMRRLRYKNEIRMSFDGEFVSE